MWIHVEELLLLPVEDLVPLILPTGQPVLREVPNQEQLIEGPHPTLDLHTVHPEVPMLEALVLAHQDPQEVQDRPAAVEAVLVVLAEVLPLQGEAPPQVDHLEVEGNKFHKT